jgi:dihydroorotate dehydrogenase electron transfer subunit
MLAMIQDLSCHVLSHRLVGRNLKLLTLKPNAPFACEPGQFVMLDLPSPRFHFRRPFSVMATYVDGAFDLFYKVVGEGTQMMADLKEGDAVSVLGPLGKGFPSLKDPQNALLLGGGIGVAPMVFVGRQAATPPHCVYGVRNKEDIGLMRELQAVFPNLHITTDDGTEGFHGNVCQYLETRPDLVATAQEAFICGPTPMMRAACNLLARLNPAIEVYVSLEEHMPCGTGACSSCVVGRLDRLLPSKTCVEGPVLPACVVDWDNTALTGGGASCSR